MKKIIYTVLTVLMFGSIAEANDFEVKARLGKHPTDNKYGVWSLEKKQANSKQMHAKILPKEKYETYPCLQYVGGDGCWDIRIIDTAAFKKSFLNHTYYHFYWKKRKNQG